MGYNQKVYSKPALDITGLHGERYRKNFVITATYDDLRPTTYTRHVVGLYSGSSEGYSVVEMRSGKYAQARTVTLYKPSETDKGFIPSKCAGVSAKPNYDKDTITYVLPVPCSGVGDSGSGSLFAESLKWTSKTWMSAAISNQTAQWNLADYTDLKLDDKGAWNWSGESPAPARTKTERPQLPF